jgi:hypothetical protein
MPKGDRTGPTGEGPMTGRVQEVGLESKHGVGHTPCRDGVIPRLLDPEAWNFQK